MIQSCASKCTGTCAKSYLYVCVYEDTGEIAETGRWPCNVCIKEPSRIKDGCRKNGNFFCTEQSVSDQICVPAPQAILTQPIATPIGVAATMGHAESRIQGPTLLQK